MRIRLAVVALAVLLVVIGSAIAQRRVEAPPPRPLVVATITSPDADTTPTPDETVSPTPVASPSATPTATRTATPTPEPTRAPPSIEVMPAAVGQGETLLVRVRADGAAGGSVLFAGATFPLIADGDALFAVLGVPLNARLGPSEFRLTTRDDGGNDLDVLVAGYDVVTVDRPVDYLTLTEEEASVLTPEASAREAQLRSEQFAEFDRPRRWNGLFRLPVEGIMTTEFGSGRSTNGGPVGGFHSGADIAAALGTPITAPAAGRVAWVGAMPIRGNTVIVDHGAGVLSGYHHLDETSVEVGQLVEAGVILGHMGSTGLSTGPHLHWELTVYGVNVDPMTWTRVDFTP